MYIDKLPDDARPIEGSYDYVDPRGNVYGLESRIGREHDRPFIKAQTTVYGYKCVGVKYPSGNKQKRVHKLVATAFIPNPDNLPIVMHSDNNKSNNNVSNLKWGTISVNTQQAVDDGLLVNASGYDDSQSISCDCYNSINNQLVAKYGSVSLASADTGISKCGILYQLRNPGIPPRKPLYFVPEGCDPIQHEVIEMVAIKTDEPIARFINIGQASRKTGIPDSTISSQINCNKKPKWTGNNYGVYFRKIIV